MTDRDSPGNHPPVLKEGRDYTVENGLWIFTAAYLLNRGYCCGSGCRNCPYTSASTNNASEDNGSTLSKPEDRKA